MIYLVFMFCYFFTLYMICRFVNKVSLVLLPCLSNPSRGGTFSSELLIGVCSSATLTCLAARQSDMALSKARRVLSQHRGVAPPPLLQLRSFDCFQGSSVGDASPSSMRVHRGSFPRVNDEDTDAESEPRLLRHSSLPRDEEPDEEPPAVVMHSHPLLDGEVQKIEKSEAEDEIVVVDDYLDDKEAEKAEEPGSGEAEQQKKDDLAEADQESSQSDSETETKTDQSFESAKEEQEDAKESGEKETDDKSAQDGEAGGKHTSEEGKKTEAQTEGGAEAKQDEQHGDKKDESSSSSDDDFVKVRPEGEKEQDATATTSQVNPQHKKEGASGGDKGASPVTEERVDVQQYYLRKKPSLPPPLPPKEKHYF